MPLLDHFHAPVSRTHSWEGFHARWASALSDALNGMLPQRYLAEPLVHTGARIAADVAEFDLARAAPEQGNGPASGVAVQTWAPPTAAQTVTMSFPDDIEVHVYDLHRDRRLVAIIELISPSNKDDAAARRGFAGKCAACLQRGIGLIMVDVVTSRGGNLHSELLDLLGQGEAFALSPGADLYAVAYRPAQRGDQSQLDIWPAALAIGQPLPLLPLALRGAFFVPIDLEATYTEARQRLRL